MTTSSPRGPARLGLRLAAQSFVGLDWDDAHDGPVAVREVGDEQARVELRVAADGGLTSVRMQRWAAPDKRPWARHLCGE